LVNAEGRQIAAIIYRHLSSRWFPAASSRPSHGGARPGERKSLTLGETGVRSLPARWRFGLVGSCLAALAGEDLFHDADFGVDQPAGIMHLLHGFTVMIGLGG